MATQFEVVLPWGTPRAAEAATDALNLIDRLEDQLSVFRASSELSRLNRTAAHAPVPVEPRLFELLSLCDRLTGATRGAFDITAAPLTRVWGFHDRAGHVPAESDLAAARETVGMGRVHLDFGQRSVRFEKPGVELNLGSIGKGFALDRAAELLQSRWRLPSFLIQGGASSVLAVGAPPDNDRGWSVDIRHPEDQRRSIRLDLRDRALGVTGTAHQHFSYNGRKLGHVLDPRTGRPCEGLALAIALAPSAAEADALSTAFFVLGDEAAAHYCAEHPEISAVLVPAASDGVGRSFNLDAIGWTMGGPAAADE